MIKEKLIFLVLVVGESNVVREISWIQREVRKLLAYQKPKDNKKLTTICIKDT